MRRMVVRIVVGAVGAFFLTHISLPAMADDPASPLTKRPLPGAAQQTGARTTASPASRKPQPTVYSSYGSTTPTVIRPSIDARVTSQTGQTLNFYGGNSARATLSQMPRRSPLQSHPVLPARAKSKPFQTVYRDPTISPYLNLYRQDETTGSAPNYFAFVRPQMDQIEANRAQQRELQQLQGQLNGASSSVVGANYQSGPLKGTGTATRYMDTAQFYSGMRR